MSLALCCQRKGLKVLNNAPEKEVSGFGHSCPAPNVPRPALNSSFIVKKQFPQPWVRRINRS
jgi:hypothetical protein